MDMRPLYLLIAGYGLLALVVNSIGLEKFGPSPFGIFQIVGGAVFLAVGLLAFAGRIGGRSVASVVAVLVAVDVSCRLLT